MKSSEIISKAEDEAKAIGAAAEAGAKSLYAKGKAWFAGRSRWTKGIIIAGVAIAAIVAIDSAFDKVESVGSVARSYVPSVTYSEVTKADLAAVDRKADTFKADLQKASDGYKRGLDDLKQRIDTLDDKLGQMATELGALEEKVAALPAPAPTPPIVTGTVQPKRKKAAVPPPASSWFTLPTLP